MKRGILYSFLPEEADKIGDAEGEDGTVYGLYLAPDAAPLIHDPQSGMCWAIPWGQLVGLAREEIDKVVDGRGTQSTPAGDEDTEGCNEAAPVEGDHKDRTEDAGRGAASDDEGNPADERVPRDDADSSADAEGNGDSDGTARPVFRVRQPGKPDDRFGN